jgi:hypothetical protein
MGSLELASHIPMDPLCALLGQRDNLETDELVIESVVHWPAVCTNLHIGPERGSAR